MSVAVRAPHRRRLLGLERPSRTDRRGAGGRVRPAGKGLPSVSDGTEAPILTRVAAGDAAAMRTCVDRYGPLVWKLAWRMLPARNEVEDAVQEVFISLWENADRYTDEFGEETTFVAMIARRRLIDRGRRMRHQRQLRERATERAGASPELPGVRAVTGDAPADPSEPVAEAEEVSRVREAMKELPERQRELLELALATGASHSEIAGRLDMPLGTVKTLIRRGMIRLRELVERAAEESAASPVERSA